MKNVVQNNMERLEQKLKEKEEKDRLSEAGRFSLRMDRIYSKNGDTSFLLTSLKRRWPFQIHLAFQQSGS